MSAHDEYVFGVFSFISVNAMSRIQVHLFDNWITHVKAP